jgi:hypothetical protein
MRTYPAHEDLGLVEDDFTEDLRANRPGNSDAARAATPTASEPSTHLRTEIVR